ncbi:dual specificity protein phosphatase family protein [Spiroplasma tabanidicola]|uniref:Tyrosine specific protein phosphatases domain-containing protein n=1 Tax=Spiroplasma tabanidicola TaxID=324079 RepID=A0A6I6C5B3_9MOLU|nr:dual specificity protein phosphatase [Spiroplasma tabanidicola]QGS52037.1 hypothetical protein STABA_v1c06780 [Spiroplasma tabanidicola]
MRKIINNLFLGDKNSAPKETQLRISCAEEIFLNNSKSDNNEIYWDDKNNVLYYNFEDFPIYKNIDVNLVNEAIETIEKNIKNRVIYVHCVWGINRSPSIVFMYMVRNNLIKGDTYQESQKEFWKIYPDHKANPGWKEFLIKQYPYRFNK